MQWKRKITLVGDGVGQTGIWREGGWEGNEEEARAAVAAVQIARTTGHGSSKKWKKDLTGVVRHSVHRLDLLCGVGVPLVRYAAAVCFPGFIASGVGGVFLEVKSNTALVRISRTCHLSSAPLCINLVYSALTPSATLSPHWLMLLVSLPFPLFKFVICPTLFAFSVKRY
jgi:hypothetical protein